MGKNTTEPWFARCIAVGLTRLAALQLPGTPIDAQTAAAMRDVWVETLWKARRWDEGLDAARIEAAFGALAARCTRFAAPAQFLEVLAPRQAAPIAAPPILSEEQRMANMARVREMLAAVYKRLDGGNDASRKG